MAVSLAQMQINVRIVVAGNHNPSGVRIRLLFCLARVLGFSLDVR